MTSKMNTDNQMILNFIQYNFVSLTYEHFDIILRDHNCVKFLLKKLKENAWISGFSIGEKFMKYYLSTHERTRGVLNMEVKDTDILDLIVEHYPELIAVYDDSGNNAITRICMTPRYSTFLKIINLYPGLIDFQNCDGEYPIQFIPRGKLCCHENDAVDKIITYFLESTDFLEKDLIHRIDRNPKDVKSRIYESIVLSCASDAVILDMLTKRRTYDKQMLNNELNYCILSLENRYESIRKLLTLGADPNFEGEHYFSSSKINVTDRAIEENKKDVFKLLESFGGVPTIFFYLSSNSDLEFMLYLIEKYNMDINMKIGGLTFFQHAMESASFAPINVLLHMMNMPGADLKIVTEKNRTLLHDLFRGTRHDSYNLYNMHQIIQTLVQKGVDPYHVDTRGLYFFSKHPDRNPISEQTVNFLKKIGIDIEESSQSIDESERDLFT